MFTVHQLLIFAARAGNVDLVRERIAAGADVHYYDEQHGAALFEAIRCRHTPVVELLLSHGADLGMTDLHGQGPLEHALRAGDDDLVLRLLRSGARLQAHARNHFKGMLSECLQRRGIQNDSSMA